MKSWHDVPFARLLLPLIAGIACYSAFPSIHHVYVILLICGVMLALAGLIRFGKLRIVYFTSSLRGAGIMLAFFTLGALLSAFHNPVNYGKHYSRFKLTDTILVRVQGDIREKAKAYSLFVRVEGIRTDGIWQSADGKVAVNWKKNKNLPKPDYGGRYLMAGKFTEPGSPRFDGDFNYKTWLNNKGILHVFLPKSILPSNAGENTVDFRGFIFRLRDRLNSLLVQSIQDKNAAGVASALIFGVKDRLDAGSINAFAGTGVMHVLAVSGMHVGILYAALHLIFTCFGRGKRSENVKSVLLIVILAMYAGITGMTPSVVRAVTMFGLMRLSGMLGRKNTPMNTLFATATVMLLNNPGLIYETGFQLSFAAVAGILQYYRPLFQFLRTSNGLLNRILSVLTLTICAQIYTFPLGLYHFGGFPLYFLPANLLVVPVFSLLMLLALAALIFSFWPAAAGFFGLCFTWLYTPTRHLMDFISGLPGAIQDGGLLDILLACLLLTAGWFLGMAFLHAQKRSLLAGLVLFFAIGIYTGYKKYTEINRKQVAVLYSKGAEVPVCITGRYALVLLPQVLTKNWVNNPQWIRFKRKTGIDRFQIIDPDENLVTTNFCQIKGQGFQFFDIVVTMTKKKLKSGQIGLKWNIIKPVY